MVYIRQAVQRHSRHQHADVVVIRLMLLIAHIEHCLAAGRQKDMRTNQHVVGIDAQIMAACAYRPTQLHQLLKQPSAAITHAAVGILYLDI